MRSSVCIKACLWLTLLLGFQAANAGQIYFAGTVVDANNQPITGATIQAGHRFSFSGPLTVDGQATTDAQGYYAMTMLDDGDGSGQYVITAQDADRVSVVYPDSPCYSTNACPPDGFPPTVAVPNLSVNFLLLHPASIGGHVHRTDMNSDLSGVTVYLYRQFESFANADTDAAGNYVFSGLVPDTYELSVGYGQVQDQFALLPQVYAGHDYDILSGWPTADDVVLGDGQATTGVDFALNPGGTIQGAITSAIDAQPLAAAIGIRRLTPDDGGGFSVVTRRRVMQVHWYLSRHPDNTPSSRYCPERSAFNLAMAASRMRRSITWMQTPRRKRKS